MFGAVKQPPRRGVETRGAGTPAAPLDGTPCQGKGWDPHSGQTMIGQDAHGPIMMPGSYSIPFNGIYNGGTCVNMDGQTCGVGKIFSNGQCVQVPPNSLQIPSAIEQKYYQDWSDNYFDLQDTVLKAMAANSTPQSGGTKFNYKMLSAWLNYQRKTQSDRGSFLRQIKAGQAPAALVAMREKSADDATQYDNDTGGIPITLMQMASRDGTISDAARWVYSQAPEGKVVLAAVDAWLKKHAAAHQKANPFPARPVHPAFVPPTVGPTGIASRPAKPPKKTASADVPQTYDCGNGHIVTDLSACATFLGPQNVPIVPLAPVSQVATGPTMTSVISTAPATGAGLTAPALQRCPDGTYKTVCPAGTFVAPPPVTPVSQPVHPVTVETGSGNAAQGITPMPQTQFTAPGGFPVVTGDPEIPTPGAAEPGVMDPGGTGADASLNGLAYMAAEESGISLGTWMVVGLLAFFFIYGSGGKRR